MAAEREEEPSWSRDSKATPTADLRSLGAFIRNRRQLLGLTQVQLGARLDWVQERISSLENGRYGLPSLPALARIASGLETSLSAVIHAAGFPDIAEGLERQVEQEPQSATLFLYTLERLLSIEAAGMRQVLDEASGWIAQAVQADKVDIFLADASAGVLQAVGTSDTPMGHRQYELGMNRLLISDGGNTVTAYVERRTVRKGNVQRDPEELPGLTQGLGVQSMLLVPIIIQGVCRGVFAAVSAERDRFSEEDGRFFEIVTRWIALIAHREELLAARSHS